tara:strand:- start:265 stop:1131 length:867 start_codon:yes stop_codon:yes gene_type:complete
MAIHIEKIRKTKPIEELLKFSIINIDKPSGPTSFGTDTIIKNALNLTKTSHFGTLDPAVTGILPVALNRACKLMGYFIGKNKTYVGIMKLHKEISRENLQKEINNFIGEITQLPPIKSRVKRQERQRTIHTFKILEMTKRDVLFETEVEAGTYIRKLIHDLGEVIGGAHMLELRRTQASIFQEPSLKIPEFLKAVEEYKKGNETPLRKILIPGEIISQVLEEVQIKPNYVKRLYHGRSLMQEHLKNKQTFKDDQKIAVFENETFIGTYNVINERNTVAKPLYVLQPIK